MTLSSYEIFLAVCTQQSFQKAALQLNLTPSAVSHAISAMEKEVGFSLFARGRTHVALTSQGEELLPHIQAVCNADSVLSQAIAQLNHLESGHVKLGCLSSVCIHWLPDIFRDFRKAFPHISLTVYQGTYDDIAQWIKTGQVDLGFLSHPSAQGLDFLPLYEDPFVCLVPEDFQTLHEDYITIDEMKNHTFVTLREGSDDDVKSFMDAHNLSAHSCCFVEDDRSAAALVSSGMGFCVMPELAVLPLYAPVRLLTIKPELSRTIGLSVNPACSSAPAVQKMKEYIISHVTKKTTSAD